MGELPKQKDLASYMELLIANSIQVDTLCQLLIEKGIIGSNEYFNKLKEVKAEYRRGNVPTYEC